MQTKHAHCRDNQLIGNKNTEIKPADADKARPLPRESADREQKYRNKIR